MVQHAFICFQSLKNCKISCDLQYNYQSLLESAILFVQRNLIFALLRTVFFLCCTVKLLLWTLINCDVQGVGVGVCVSVTQWLRVGLLFNRSSNQSCARGMIHNNTHLINSGCPRPSIAFYSTELWPKTTVIVMLLIEIVFQHLIQYQASNTYWIYLSSASCI